MKWSPLLDLLKPHPHPHLYSSEVHAPEASRPGEHCSLGHKKCSSSILTTPGAVNRRNQKRDAADDLVMGHLVDLVSGMSRYEHLKDLLGFNHLRIGTVLQERRAIKKQLLVHWREVGVQQNRIQTLHILAQNVWAQQDDLLRQRNAIVAGSLVTLSLTNQRRELRRIEETMSGWATIGDDQLDQQDLALHHRDVAYQHLQMMKRRKEHLDEALKKELYYEQIVLEELERLWESCESLSFHRHIILYYIILTAASSCPVRDHQIPQMLIFRKERAG